MYLGPHHFQAERDYFENCVRFATESLWFQPWGLAGLELDPEAVRNGTLSLIHARGVFPDGLSFHIPVCDPAPPARSIVDVFPVTRHQAVVLLGIPSSVPSGANCVLPGAPPADLRFVAESQPLFDESTGQDQRPVFFARKNLRFLLDTEVHDALDAIPVARIQREGAGFAIDGNFIPPCLNIGASPRLMLYCHQLIEILQEKSRMVAVPGASLSDLAGGMSGRQVATFWFLHAVNTGLAALRHLGLTKHGHPEEVYRALSTLAGALCTFGIQSLPSELPAYDHNDLTGTFEALDRHIREHLELLAPSNCVVIPLQPTGEKYLYEGTIPDERCLHRARWILSIRCPIGEAPLISMTPQLVKVCSSRFIGELVRRALPGLTLTHLPLPPAAVSPRVDFQYFGVTREGPCWEDISKTKNVGVYVPGDLPNAEIQLAVLLDS
jgi:type VI secretion system protein ImpJ